MQEIRFEAIEGTIFTESFLSDHHGADKTVKDFFDFVSSIIQQLVGCYIANDALLFRNSLYVIVGWRDKQLSMIVIQELVVLCGSGIVSMSELAGVSILESWTGLAEMYEEGLEDRKQVLG